MFSCRNTDRRSKLISAPTNFNHISHMGPGEGIQRQRLIDLTTNLVDAAAEQNMYGNIPQAKVNIVLLRDWIVFIFQRVIFQQNVQKMAPLPPKHGERKRPEISNPTPIRPTFPAYNGAKRAAPPRPRDLPPALPRPSDTSPSPDPASIGSMSSLHDMIKVSNWRWWVNRLFDVLMHRVRRKTVHDIQLRVITVLIYPHHRLHKPIITTVQVMIAK